MHDPRMPDTGRDVGAAARARVIHSCPWLGLALLVALRLPLLATGARDDDEGVYRLTLGWLGRAALYRDVYLSQPPVFPALLVPWRTAAGEGLAADRAGVLLVAVTGSALAVLWLLRRAGPLTAALAAGALALDPSWLRAATTLQAEGVALGLALAGVGIAGLAGDGRRGRAVAAAAGAVLTAAVLAKLLAVPALVAAWVLLGGADGRARRGAAVAGAAAMAAIVAALLGSDMPAMLRQAVGLHLGARGTGLGGLDADFLQAAAFELPIAALAVAGGFRGRRRHSREAVALIAWAAVAIPVTAVQNPLWPHHLAAIGVPLAALVGFTAPVATGRHRVGTRGSVALGAAAALVAAGLVAELRLVRATPAAPAPALVRFLRDLPPGVTVVSDAEEAVAEAGRTTPPALVDTSFVRVLSGDLDPATLRARLAAAAPAVVVLATGRLERVPGFEAWLRAHSEPPVTVAGARIYTVSPVPG